MNDTLKRQNWFWQIALVLLLPLVTLAFTHPQGGKIAVVVAAENPNDRAAVQLASQLQQKIIRELQDSEFAVTGLRSESSHATSLQQAERNGCQYLLFINFRAAKTGGSSARDRIGSTVETLGNLGGMIDIFRSKGSAREKAESAGRTAESAAGAGSGTKSSLLASVEVRWTNVARRTSQSWNFNSDQTSQGDILDDLASQTVDVVSEEVNSQSSSSDRDDSSDNNQASEPDKQPLNDSNYSNQKDRACEIQITRFLNRNSGLAMGMSYSQVKRILGVNTTNSSPLIVVPGGAYGLKTDQITYWFIDGGEALKKSVPTGNLYKITFNFTGPDVPPRDILAQRMAETLGVESQWEASGSYNELRVAHLRQECGRYSLHVARGNWVILDQSVLQQERSKEERIKLEGERNQQQKYDDWRPTSSPSSKPSQTAMRSMDEERPIPKGQSNSQTSCEMAISRFLNRNPNFRLGMSYPEFMRRKPGAISYANPQQDREQQANPYQMGLIKASFVSQSPTPRQTWSRMNQQPPIIVIQGNAYGLSNQSTSYHFAMTSTDKEMSVLHKISLYWLNVPHVSILAKRMAEELDLDNDVERAQLANGGRLECKHFKVEVGPSTFSIQDTNVLKQAQEKMQKLKDIEKYNKKKQDESWRP